MRGIDEIIHVNRQRVHETVVAAQAKADVAKQQGHPKAEEFQQEANELKQRSN